MWHICWKINNDKFEKVQERSLRILHNTYELSYKDLSNINGSSTFGLLVWKHTNPVMAWMQVTFIAIGEIYPNLNASQRWINIWW